MLCKRWREQQRNCFEVFFRWFSQIQWGADFLSVRISEFLCVHFAFGILHIVWSRFVYLLFTKRKIMHRCGCWEWKIKCDQPRCKFPYAQVQASPAIHQERAVINPYFERTKWDFEENFFFMTKSQAKSVNLIVRWCNFFPIKYALHFVVVRHRRVCNFKKSLAMVDDESYYRFLKKTFGIINSIYFAVQVNCIACTILSSE